MGLVAVVGAVLYALGPVLVPLGNLNLLIFFVVLVAIMVFAAVPIAFAFGLATFAYITLTTSTPSTVVIDAPMDCAGRVGLTIKAAYLKLGIDNEAGRREARLQFFQPRLETPLPAPRPLQCRTGR